MTEESIKLAENNKHISTEVIEQDIVDTQNEIITMEREIKEFRLIGDRMSIFRANARESGVRERKEFIGKLEMILAKRAIKGR